MLILAVRCNNCARHRKDILWYVYTYALKTFDAAPSIESLRVALSFSQREYRLVHCLLHSCHILFVYSVSLFLGIILCL